MRTKTRVLSTSALLLPLLVLATATPSHALFGGTFAANPCIAGKVQCVAKKKTCLLNCHSKALHAGVAVDPGCLTKCRTKFAPNPAGPGEGCFAKLEAKGGCGASVGNSAPFEAKIDAYVEDAVGALVPNGGNPENLCTSRKLSCLRKYNGCLLKLVEKAVKKGTAVGDVAKCTRVLDGSATSCIGKLETKYCEPGVDCDSTATPCLTFDDQTIVRNGDDAFVDDVVATLVNGPSATQTQRCIGDTSVPCSSAPGGSVGCGGPLGTCEFQLGAPLPFPFGGFPLCFTNRWNGPLTGTFDQASGASAGTAALLTNVYAGIALAQPCPRCSGDDFPNDGANTGVCDGGPRNGMPCDGHGASAQPAFGTTSRDCPPAPGALIGTLALDLPFGNDGAVAKTVGLDSPPCDGAPGKICLCGSCSLDDSRACENDLQCASAGAGTCASSTSEPQKPNACIDDTTQPGDGTICASAGGGRGTCSEGPVDTFCRIEDFRGCINDGDCPAAGDFCTAGTRPCYLGYDGNVGDTVSAIGSHDAPQNGAIVTTFGGVACGPATTANFVNEYFGMPGPVRMQLDGVASAPDGPGCPTTATFVTSSSGTLDYGWTGVGHGKHMIGQAEVTVDVTCTGAPPNCACSYTGPVGN